MRTDPTSILTVGLDYGDSVCWFDVYIISDPASRISAFQLGGEIKSDQTVIDKVDMGDTLRNP